MRDGRCYRCAPSPDGCAGMTSETDKQALLGQLRIDRGEPPPSADGRRRTWIVGGGLALAALVALGAWLALSARAAPPVHTVAAQAIAGGNGGGASVLDATGYVTARRQATVSAQ